MKRRAGRPRGKTGGSRVLVTVSGCDARLARMVRRAARFVLAAEGVRRGQLDVTVVDAARMRREHRRWMGQGSLTDVITFDLREEESDGAIDGHLIVSDDEAKRQAARRGGEWTHELLLYVAHGCLHLVGHDDARPRDFARMHRREDELLAAMGMGKVFSSWRR